MIMKKLLFITLVCWLAIAVSAQNQVQTAILQHGAETTVYNGSQALVNAYNAAVNGDIITLSAGTFTATNIEKSIMLYGAGFENNDDKGTHLTILGGFAVGLANDTLRNVHVEGIYVNGRLRIAGGPTDQLHIVKCYVNEHIFFEQMSQNTIIDQCIVKSNLTSYNSRYLAKNMLVTNTLVQGNLNGFTSESTVMVDHCMLRNQLWKYDETAAFTWINCIFYNDDRACWDTDYRMVSPASVVRNCIHVQDASGSYNTFNGFRDADVDGCWLVRLADIFADGENGAYTETRTYELQQPDVWVGTDGTEVGLRGGHGWSKAPGIPVVKHMQLAVEGTQLKVDYEAEAR